MFAESACPRFSSGNGRARRDDFRRLPTCQIGDRPSAVVTRLGLPPSSRAFIFLCVGCAFMPDDLRLGGLRIGIYCHNPVHQLARVLVTRLELEICLEISVAVESG